MGQCQVVPINQTAITNLGFWNHVWQVWVNPITNHVGMVGISSISDDFVYDGLYPLVIKHGNGKFPINGGFNFNNKILDKWSIFRCHVWLPDGTMLYQQEDNPRRTGLYAIPAPPVSFKPQWVLVRAANANRKSSVIPKKTTRRQPNHWDVAPWTLWDDNEASHNVGPKLLFGGVFLLPSDYNYNHHKPKREIVAICTSLAIAPTWWTIYLSQDPQQWHGLWWNSTANNED